MAGSARFKETGEESLFGRFVYDRAVSAGHFLRKLEKVIPWSRFTAVLLRWYQGQGQEGRPPYEPAVILKMLLLSYLYNLSERQTEVIVNDSISMKCFVGLAVDEPAPDHSTLTAFKRRIIENGGLEGLEEILGEVVRIAQEAGVEFGAVQVIDSTHTMADVNTQKDKRRQEEWEEEQEQEEKQEQDQDQEEQEEQEREEQEQEEKQKQERDQEEQEREQEEEKKRPGSGSGDAGEESVQKGRAPRDPTARWGAKHSRWVKNERGERMRQTEYFFGYKAHVSLNAEAGLITSIIVTPGNAPDGKQLPALVERDMRFGLPIQIVAADRAYDDGDNHVYLASKGLHSAIQLNTYRTEKKDKNKEVWLELKRTPAYQAGCKERYTIERKFGEAKQSHGLRRCRYVGLLRYALQATMTALVLNMKRLVKLLTGENFKGRATADA